MRAFIQKIPVPLSGVMLGCAALGNLLQSHSQAARTLCGGVSFLLLLLLAAKLCFFPKSIAEDLKTPIMMSVSATFPMGIMLLSVYAKPFLGPAATVIWFAAIALHIVLICAFTYRFMRKPDLQKVFASYFIVYVGIAAAGITAPAFGMQAVGTVAFWFGLISFIGLLGLISYRYLKHPAVPDPAKPLFCIVAAPGSLCLAAYLQSARQKSVGFVAVLAVLAAILYLISLIRLVGFLRLPFCPGYAAFAFPFVVGAVAMKQTAGYLAAAGFSVPFLSPVVLAQTVVATVLVCYTLIRFGMFLLSPQKAKPAAVAEKGAGTP